MRSFAGSNETRYQRREEHWGFDRFENYYSPLRSKSVAALERKREEKKEREREKMDGDKYR